MPFLRLTRVEEATGLLKKEFDAAIARAGKVFNIVQAMSLRPAVLRRSMHFNYINRVADAVGVEDEPDWT